jgi:hypothetical protein
MLLKYSLLAILAVQLVGSFSVEGIPGSFNNNKGNFYEWTLTATTISMFISIGLDCNRFELVYEEALEN